MRIRIVFDLINRGASVPFHHQHLISTFIADLLEEDDDLECAGRDKYNFSGLKGQTKVSKEGLQFLSKKVTLVFSSHDEEVIERLLEILFKKNQVSVGDLLLSPDSAEKESEVELEQETKFLCISPVTLLHPMNSDRDHKEFIDPTSDEFSDLLYEITMDRIERSGLFSDEQIASFFKFQIVPDKAYLEKLRREDKKFSRIYNIYFEGQKHEVRGYTFPFNLYAEKAVQEFVYERGLGLFTCKGFGMIDIANANNIKTLTKIEFNGKPAIA